MEEKMVETTNVVDGAEAAVTEAADDTTEARMSDDELREGLRAAVCTMGDLAKSGEACHPDAMVREAERRWGDDGRRIAAKLASLRDQLGNGYWISEEAAIVVHHPTAFAEDDGSVEG